MIQDTTSLLALSIPVLLWLSGRGTRPLPRKVLPRSSSPLSLLSLIKIAAPLFLLGLTFFPVETRKIIGAQTTSSLIPVFAVVGGLAVISAAARLAGALINVTFWGAITATLLTVPLDGERSASAASASIAGIDVQKVMRTGGSFILDGLKKTASLGDFLK